MSVVGGGRGIGSTPMVLVTQGESTLAAFAVKDSLTTLGGADEVQLMATETTE